MKYIVLFLMSFDLWATEVIGIQNFLQIPTALESITGISNREQNILNFYNERKLSFPKSGELAEVTESFLINQLSYSQMFCQRMIEKDSKKPAVDRWAHKHLDFSLPINKWASTTVNLQLNEYANMFWLRDLNSSEQSELTSFAGVLIAEVGSSPDGAIKALSTICAVMGTSFSFLQL